MKTLKKILLDHSPFIFYLFYLTYCVICIIDRVQHEYDHLLAIPIFGIVFIIGAMFTYIRHRLLSQSSYCMGLLNIIIIDNIFIFCEHITRYWNPYFLFLQILLLYIFSMRIHELHLLSLYYKKHLAATTTMVGGKGKSEAK